jgi:hypothetical protein
MTTNRVRAEQCDACMHCTHGKMLPLCRAGVEQCDASVH